MGRTRCHPAALRYRRREHQREGLVVSCTASVILIAAYRHSLYHWLNVWWIQFLGKISYSIYLVHVPIAGVILGLQVRIAPRSQFVSFLMLAIVVVATIGLAFILNRFIEEPSLRLSHRFKTMKDWRCPGRIALPYVQWLRRSDETSVL